MGSPFKYDCNIARSTGRFGSGCRLGPRRPAAVGHERTLAPASMRTFERLLRSGKRHPYPDNVTTARESDVTKTRDIAMESHACFRSKATTLFSRSTDAECCVSLVEMQGAHCTVAARDGGYNTCALDDQSFLEQIHSNLLDARENERGSALKLGVRINLAVIPGCPQHWLSAKKRLSIGVSRASA